MKKINEIFSSLPATMVGGAFLVLSFLLPRFGAELPADPAWIAVVICGFPLLCSAVRKLVFARGISKISSALLITAAMIASVAIGDIFAAGEVAFIMAIGEILEDATTDRAKRGLKKLISLAPAQGRRICDGKEEMIPAEEILCGDILRILPGETIPVDGIILEGETSVDQSVMTGESLPADKTVGDEVFCGTVNRFGAVDIRATKVGEDSSLQKLIRMVQEAEDKKAPMARTMDRCASWMVPLALGIAVVAGIVTRDIVRAVTVLVVFCPCALVLATPTAIMAAIGQATKRGVIIKSGEALEKLGKVDTVAFDKTGTLTCGKLEVSNTVVFDGAIGEEELLILAAAAEAKSEHPLGKAVVSFAKKRALILPDTRDFTMNSGKGIAVRIDSDSILCGSARYLEENGVRIPQEHEAELEKLRGEGKALILVARNGECIGVIALSDVLRDEASDMVRRLESMGVSSVLLTGDNKRSADYFAARAGIGEVRAELLPEGKVQALEEMMAGGRGVCMIGDGVNDAPALKTAHLGVAMGSMGSDIAVEAADIALMRDDLSAIPYLKRLSNATVRTIALGITLSMVINIIAVILSVMGLLTPTVGALVHNAGSVLVVLIAAALYDRRFE